MGATFLFQVDYLSGLGVIGVLKKKLKGGGTFRPPYLKCLKYFLIQSKKLRVNFLFQINWLSGLGVIGIY